MGWIIPTLTTLVIYLLTMCRTVYVGDSGEFSLVMKTLGIAHPPGYPLFTLAGHFFMSLFGFLKPALAANLFGVLAAVAAIPALFFLLEGKRQPLIAAALCLVWAFSPSFWGETGGIEVYALNLALIAGIAAAALSDHPRKWFMVSYLLGLSLTHHLSALAVIPAVIYLYLTETTSNRWKYSSTHILLFILGISLYLYLPIRASQSPLADWGHPVSLSLLWNHLTAAQYQQAAAFSLSNLWESLKLYFTLVIGNWWWIGLGLAIWGAYDGFIRNRRRTIFILIILVVNLTLSAFYRIPDIDPYYLPGLLVCWLLMGQGLFGLSSRTPALKPLWTWGTALAAIVLLILNYRDVDRSKVHIGEDFGRLILDTAAEGTIFTSNDNASFTAMYLRYAEGYRPQVEIFDQGLRAYSLMVETARISGQTVYSFKEARNLYLQKARGDKYLEDLQTVPDVQNLMPYGVLYALQPPRRPAPIPSLWSGRPPRDYKARQILVNLELVRGGALLLQSPPDSLRALESFRRAFNLLEGEPRAALHNQLGIALRHKGSEELALASYDRALRAPRRNSTERFEIIFNISNIYKDRGNRLAQGEDYVGAVEAFTKSLEYDPGNPTIIYNVGVIYANYLHKPDLALPYLESYLATNPTDQKVGKLVRELRGR